MFIHSKKNINIKLKNGSVYKIFKNYIGNIPDYIASHWIVQASIKDGSIIVSRSTKDKDFENAAEESKVKEEVYDIREKPMEAAEESKVKGKNK